MSKIDILTISGHTNNWEGAIKLCGNALVNLGYADESFIEACISREKEFPTGLAVQIPVAIPHCDCEGLKKDCLCFLRLDEPVKFYRMDSSDEFLETKLIFNIGIKGHDDHVKFLAKLINAIQHEEIMNKCIKLPLEDVKKLLNELVNS